MGSGLEPLRFFLLCFFLFSSSKNKKEQKNVFTQAYQEKRKRGAHKINSFRGEVRKQNTHNYAFNAHVWDNHVTSCFLCFEPVLLFNSGRNITCDTYFHCRALEEDSLILPVRVRACICRKREGKDSQGIAYILFFIKVGHWCRKNPFCVE